MRIWKLAPLALAFASLAAFAPAQTPCSTLTVSGSGAPGTDLVFDLNGAAAEAPALAVIGDTTGSTSIRFGMLGTLDLGLEHPFVPLLLGQTDTNGDASRTITVPPNIMPASLHAQGFSVEFNLPGPPSSPGGPPSFGLTFCTSNVVAFSIG